MPPLTLTEPVRIRSGTVGVNGGTPINGDLPFGGYKHSGIGREYSLEGMLDSFTQRKNVTINLLR